MGWAATDLDQPMLPDVESATEPASRAAGANAPRFSFFNAIASVLLLGIFCTQIILAATIVSRPSAALPGPALSEAADRREVPPQDMRSKTLASSWTAPDSPPTPEPPTPGATSPAAAGTMTTSFFDNGKCRGEPDSGSASTTTFTYDTCFDASTDTTIWSYVELYNEEFRQALAAGGQPAPKDDTPVFTNEALNQILPPYRTATCNEDGSVSLKMYTSADCSGSAVTSADISSAISDYALDAEYAAMDSALGLEAHGLSLDTFKSKYLAQMAAANLEPSDMFDFFPPKVAAGSCHALSRAAATGPPGEATGGAEYSTRFEFTGCTAAPGYVPPCPGKHDFDDQVEGMARKEGFFTLYTENSTAPSEVYLEIPESELDTPFVVRQVFEKGDGVESIRGVKVGDSTWQWARSPGNEADPAKRRSDSNTWLDLKQPQLAIRTDATRQLAPEQADSAWTGWEQTVQTLGTRSRCGGQTESHLVNLVPLLQGLFTGENTLRGELSSFRITSARAFPDNLEFVVEFLWGEMGSLSRQPVSLHISLLKLPATPMVGRVSDNRIGYFESAFIEFGVDDQTGDFNKMTKLCQRWRLEKQDEACESDCEPRMPLKYYVDPSVPSRWRAAAKRAVENWDGPFSAAGWSNAIVAVLPGDADFPTDFDASDARYPSISWGPMALTGVSLGTISVDPRSGEILTADIYMSSIFIEGWMGESRLAKASGGVKVGTELESYNDPSALRASLVATGDISLGDPIPEEFINQALTDVLMHEVGHTLGLRHNFRGSTFFTQEQLGDVDFLTSTELHGTAAGAVSSSVMDYVPINLPADPSKRGLYYSQNPGKYDHAAIQYGYSDVSTQAEPEATGTQHSSLLALAQSMTQQQLFFASDEEVGPGHPFADPYAQRFDMSAEPMDYFVDTLSLMNDAVKAGLNTAVMTDDDTWYRSASELASYVFQTVMVGAQLAPYVGGRAAFHAHRGDSLRPFEAVPLDKQQEAFALILRVLTDNSLLPPAEVARYMATDQDGFCSGWTEAETDNFCLGVTAIDLVSELGIMRTWLLNRVFAPERLARLEENVWGFSESADSGAWTSGTVCDIVTLELFPEFGERLVPVSAVDERVADAAVAGVQDLDHRRQLFAQWREQVEPLRDELQLDGWTRVSEYSTAAHEQQLKRQLQASWVRLLVSLRDSGQSPYQVAVSTSAQHVQSGLALASKSASVDSATAAFFASLLQTMGKSE